MNIYNIIGWIISLFIIGISVWASYFFYINEKDSKVVLVKDQLTIWGVTLVSLGILWAIITILYEIDDFINIKLYIITHPITCLLKDNLKRLKTKLN